MSRFLTTENCRLMGCSFIFYQVKKANFDFWNLFFKVCTECVEPRKSSAPAPGLISDIKLYCVLGLFFLPQILCMSSLLLLDMCMVAFQPAKVTCRYKKPALCSAM